MKRGKIWKAAKINKEILRRGIERNKCIKML